MQEARDDQQDPTKAQRLIEIKDSIGKPLLKKIERVINNLTYSTDGSLNMNHGSWKKNNLASICEHIQSLAHTGLRLNENKASDIPKAISTIRMDKMKVLQLFNNFIESVEPLTSIFLPQLEHLVLYGNKIVNVHSFRRSFWPSIKVINISNNRITEFLALTQMKAPTLTSLSTEWQPDPPLSMNCSWVLKLQTEQLETLCLRSRKRMWQGKIYTKMQRKHRKRQQITIYVAFIPT